LAVSQLRECRAWKLIETLERPNPVVVLIPINAPSELVHWLKIHDLSEYGFANAYDLIPPYDYYPKGRYTAKFDRFQIDSTFFD
jgi:hypothetical protein